MSKKMSTVKALGWMTVLLFLITSFYLNAQTKKLTIDDAIKIAIENNKENKIALLNVEKANEAVDEAFGYALPVVDVSANYSRFLEKQKMPFPDFVALLGNATYGILFDENVLPRDENKFKPVNYTLQSFSMTNNYQAQINVSQVLFNSAVLTGIGASKKYSNLSKEAFRSSASKTILNVQKAFYGVLLTKELLEITKASLQNGEENLKNVKAYLSQGLVSEFDALQAEVRVENIRPIVLQMENTYKNAKEGLKMLLGLEQTEDIDVEGNISYIKEDIPDKAETISKALTSNIDIGVLELKKDVDKAYIDLERAEYWPTLAAFGNYTRSGSAEDFKFQNYSSAMVGLSFSMNLFKGLRTSHREQQAKITAQQTEEQFFQLKDFVTMQVKSKILEIERVQSNIEAQERNVKLAERANGIAQVRYKEGTGNQLEIQNSDMALRQARINKLQSEYDYMIAKFELEQLLGKLEDRFIKPYIK